MKLKNHPKKYVKRSDLPERSSRVKNAVCSALREPKDLDFSKVEIDSNFYFTEHQTSELRNIIREADIYATFQGNSGLAYWLAKHWPQIRAALMEKAKSREIKQLRAHVTKYRKNK